MTNLEYHRKEESWYEKKTQVSTSSRLSGLYVSGQKQFLSFCICTQIKKEKKVVSEIQNFSFDANLNLY